MKTLFEIEPSYEAALRAANLASFDAMMAVKTDSAVGWHKHREAAPLGIVIDGGPRRFFIKRVFKIPPKHAFWPIFRGRLGRSQPYHEWHILGELHAAGIPAMRRVAFGERRAIGMPKQAFVLVEAVPFPHTLEDWLVPGFPKPGKLSAESTHRMMRDLGELLGRLHGEGFRWPDMVAKHIFAAPDSDEAAQRWSFSLIDVERMTRSPAGVADAKDRRRDLKGLRKSLRPWPLDRDNATAFFVGYRGGLSQGARPAESCSERDIERFIDADFLPRIADDYEHPRNVSLTRGGRIFADARYMPLLQRAGLHGFKEVFDFDGGAALRKPGLQSWRDRIRFEVEDERGEKRAFYLKRYTNPPWREQLRRIRAVGPGRATAYAEVRFIKRLTMLGIPTMRSIAFGQRIKRLWEKASFAVTEEIRGESLERLAIRAASDPNAVPPPADRHEIIRQLALITRLLHGSRLFHRDLYLCHVFLTRNADGGIVLRLIDLARMIQNPIMPRRWIIKDLAALEYSSPNGLVTRADRLRFLYYYLGQPTGRCRADRDLMRRVRARALSMARHDAHRTRRFGNEAPK